MTYSGTGARGSGSGRRTREESFRADERVFTGSLTPEGSAGPGPVGRKRPVLRTLRRTVIGTLLVALLVGGGTAYRVWQVGRVDQRDHVDVAVVLGAAQYHGKPSPAFQARLKHARELFRTGTVSYIMTVGGRQSGDAYTEGGAGREWLVEHGVPAGRVAAVREGIDTLSSIRAVAGEAKLRAWSSAVIVSDPWHSQRARTMSEDQGLDTDVSPTHSGPIVQTRMMQAQYVFRETGALLFYKLTHAPAEVAGDSLG